jgi:HSP20 family protein
MLRRWYDIERDMAVMNELRSRMEEVFGDTDHQATRMTGSWPLANLYDAGNTLVAVLAVPGLSEDDIKIEAHQDALTVSGTRKVLAPEGYRVHRQERRPGRFSRSFGLPCQVDLEKTTAKLTNGVLTVTMEKHPAAQPRQISIKVE